ncbi:MAG TPA: DegT/DnrJ/EryC1/StrS family aminotransferase [Thermoanaerobaculia bacterium]|nr:DegT/DnrJ/EryC1/StrS family aminotransferase [Thermoanaerobaculia bacterium]
MTTIFTTEAVRTRPFAPPCSIGGRERELLLEVLESCSWSACRAGAQGYDVGALCEMPSADAEAFDDGEVLFLGGRWVRRLEAMFAARAGVRFAVACNSATSGLVMAAGALGLGPGDEVLVPCMSFLASATAVVPFGCTPVFVEVKPDTLCIDPADAAAKITERTKAIVAVHLGGSVADMDALRALGLPIIEDCAQAPGATWRGREVGSLGNVGVYSLTESKSITCGEGGVVVTDDPNIARRARLIRNHGEGVSDEGIVGMNFRLTDLQAALAIAQLEQLDARNRARAVNVQRLRDGLPHCFTPQAVEPHATPAWFVFKMRYAAEPGMPSRNELVELLAAEGIPAVAGYARLLDAVPLFARPGSCPRSEAINQELLWFSFINPPNTVEDMEDAIRAIEKVLG